MYFRLRAKKKGNNVGV